MKNRLKKLTLLITLIVALTVALCISICAFDYTSSEPYVDGYTVIQSDFMNVTGSRFYTNSFY